MVRLKYARKCLRCGKAFRTNTHNKVFCSPECQRLHENERRVRQRKEMAEKKKRIANEWIEPFPDIPV